MVIKTTTATRAREPAAAVAMLKDGVMNAVGLTNQALKQSRKKSCRPCARSTDLPILASVGGESVQDYVEVAEILAAGKPDALELNLSCPNVSEGG